MMPLDALAGFNGCARDGTPISLRPMSAADEPVFRDLYAEVRAPELAQVPWSAEEKRAFCDSQYSLQDKHYRAHYAQFLPLAILNGDDVIGRLYLGYFDGALILMELTVAVRARRRGIGALLVAALTRFADAAQLEMRLHVEPDNPAKALYAHAGFVDRGEAGLYQPMMRLPKVAQPNV